MVIEIDDKLKQLNTMLSELDNIYQSLLRANNVSENEYLVMFSIKELGEGCSQKDISANCLISKKTVNSIIKKFEKDGLIELRMAKYPNMQIFLTELGQQFVQDKIVPIIEVENRVLENMSNNEFEFLSMYYKVYIKGFRTQVDNYIKSKKIK